MNKIISPFTEKIQPVCAQLCSCDHPLPPPRTLNMFLLEACTVKMPKSFPTEIKICVVWLEHVTIKTKFLFYFFICEADRERPRELSSVTSFLKYL